MMRLGRFLCLLALGCAQVSCFTVDHFADDPARFDHLYFGSSDAEPLRPPIDDSKWRNYAVFGLVEWDKDQVRFAGNRLAHAGSAEAPLAIVVDTRQSFLNGLTSVGLSLIGGILAPLLFIPRETEVVGWAGG